MRRVTIVRLALCALLAVTLSAAAAVAAEPQFARLETGKGNILLVFYPELAPNHVKNFEHLGRAGFFDGTKFHRVVPGFVIQGGDPNSKDDDPRNDGMGGPVLADVLPTADAAAMQQINAALEAGGYLPLGEQQASLKQEFSQTAKHVRGTLSMARSQNVDSAGSQFFICVADTPALDGKYTIFGHTVTGMDVVDAIVGGEQSPPGSQKPTNPVTLNHVEIIDGTAGLTADEKAAWEAMPANLKNVE